MIRTGCLLLIIGVVLGCTKVSPPQNSVAGSAAEVRMPSEFVATVLRVLEENHRSGSLIFRGRCTDSGGMTDSFKISSAAHGVAPIEALRQAFVNDPTLT